MFKNKKKNSRKNNQGFNLLELMIVIAIFAILTVITVFNYRGFESNIIMTNIAHEVALSIREMQAYSLNVKAFKTGVNQTFDGGYGVQFFTNPGVGVEQKKKNFISFFDANKNGFCDGNCDYNNCNGTECISATQLSREVEVAAICVSLDSSSDISFKKNTNNIECQGTNVNKSNRLAISFKRPDPDAIIKADLDDSDSFDLPNYPKAAILLKSPQGAWRSIEILKNGQIAVKFLNN